ncbi:coniferyl alcohol acyltransferase-like [Eucalyptus grandis]|uniref:coniferyl alcohol acyltransferase-like n=1 Tax=Eucalyptus grandis TaxID=71139 RepID=UPI00192E829D|nr:coniferyl alcohol acyltransferase-like [Eucalyptus grandis]
MAWVPSALKHKRIQIYEAEATELKCGGIVVACTFDHRIVDAYSVNMFMVFWAETACSAAPISLPPSFHLSLINPSHPLCFDLALDRMYIPVSALYPPPKHKLQVDNDCLYYVTTTKLSELQQSAYSNGSKRTKLELFSAFLWRMVAESSLVVDNDDNKTMSRMGIMVDGRCRLMSQGEDDKPTPMSSYFGHMLSVPFGEKRAREVVEKPLSWVADVAHKFVERAATKEHFLDLVDWVEEHRPVPALARIFCKPSSEVEEEGSTAPVVSSGQIFLVNGMDFGLGKPVLGSYHFPWGGKAGYVMPMPNPLSNGDWVVYLHLPKSQVAFIESHPPTVFRLLTPHHLNLLWFFLFFFCEYR